MAGELIPFPWRPPCLVPGEGKAAAERVLAVPIGDRPEKAKELRLEDPEMLLCLCDILRDRWNSSPAAMKAEATFFYRFLEKPRRSVGFLDEREFFLGEFALIAGTACRFLFEREEAGLWFDRAQVNFARTLRLPVEISRLSYQRAALRFEEREYEAVLELVPTIVESFASFNVTEYALKCRFLEGASLVETERLTEALRVFGEIREDAERLKEEKLLALAYTNLFQVSVFLGEAREAMAYSRQALPLLRRLGNRVDLAKLQWGLGNLLRGQGKLGRAVVAYRGAQKEFQELEMPADVAAIHLVVADLLLDLGHDQRARWEIQAALPIIDERKMVPEGMAALSLLKKSLESSRVDREALRTLHGYFEELS